MTDGPLENYIEEPSDDPDYSSAERQALLEEEAEKEKGQ